jgi:hypothetical protein
LLKTSKEYVKLGIVAAYAFQVASVLYGVKSYVKEL